MNKTVKLVAFLACISALSGACLSAVNGITSPIIEEAKLAEVKASLDEFYPNATFKELDIALEKGSKIQNIYEAEGKGYIYKVSVNGYGGEVAFLVAMNTDGSYQGFKAVTFDQETAGFGQRIGTDEFSSQFSGKKVGDGIDALAGATITSKATIAGIKEAATHYEENYK